VVVICMVAVFTTTCEISAYDS